jgi:hypothetical protein
LVEFGDFGIELRSRHFVKQVGVLLVYRLLQKLQFNVENALAS